MSKLMDTVGGCYMKLIIVAVICAIGPYLLNSLLFHSDEETTQKALTALSPTKQKIKNKIKDFLNDFLGIEDEFDKIKAEIEQIENEIAKINTNPIKKINNDFSKTYNLCLNQHNQLINLNNKLEEFNIKLFYLKKEITSVYLKELTTAYDEDEVDSSKKERYLNYIKKSESYNYYNNDERESIIQTFNSILDCKVAIKRTPIDGELEGGKSNKNRRETHKDESIKLVPSDISDGMLKLDTDINVLITETNNLLIQIEQNKNNLIELDPFISSLNNSTCWYIIGTAEELEKLNVVRQKSLLKWNFGATLNDEGMFDKRRFFEGDKTKISKILIPNGYNDYEILTDMPSESYKENHDYIEIKDPTKFWSNTDFLVILLEGEKKEYK